MTVSDQRVQCDVMVVGKVWQGRKGWSPRQTHRCLKMARPGETRCFVHLNESSLQSALTRALALVEANGYTVTKV